MTQPLNQRVRRFISRQRLWPRGARVVAALSGGADSVAQLLVLRDLAAAGDLVLAGAAHLNHQLRAAAAADEAFCRLLCARLQVPLDVESAPVASLAADWHLSIEAAARRARYAFFERARVRLGAEVVAVAHTAEDQAETVLLRLLRGAGTRGLRGILAKRGAVVRPLLDCRREALRALLAEREEGWVEDHTNADVGVPRNRVRHELLPLLAARFQPAVVRVLARTAEVAAGDDALLESLAAEACARTIRATSHGVALSRAALQELPPALARRVVRRALTAAGARVAPDLADVDVVLAVSASGGPAAGQAAGLRVERFAPDAVLLTGESSRPLAVVHTHELLVPGSVDLPELGPGCRLSAEPPIREQGQPADAPYRLRLKRAVPTPLTVRARLPGDRIRPAGLDGTKKLQDLLVDRKVPRRERDRVPVVVDATGRIVWVVGHAADDAAVAAAGEDDVIVLIFHQPVESGSEGS